MMARNGGRVGQDLSSLGVTRKDLVSPTVHLRAQLIAHDEQYAPMGSPQLEFHQTGWHPQWV